MDAEHREVSSKLIRITLMSLIFMAVELVGGYLANSIAIFADAFHLLSDVLAYLISLGAVWLSTRPNPPRYLSFGWEKAQPLGALINVAIIYVVTAELFIEATRRMVHQDIVEEPKYMLMTSIFGLGCNLIIMKILHSDPHGGHAGCSHSHGEHGHSHDHSHDHSHGH
jgi:cation diffusion facilitator family transporter